MSTDGAVLTWRVTEFWLRSFRRTWRGSAFTSVLAPVLYLGSIGFGLGRLVDSSGGHALGVGYASFVAPGVLAATVMQMGVGESTYPVLGAVRWQRQYHAMLATTLRVRDLVLGQAAYIALRSLLVAAIYVAVAAPFGVWRSWAVLAAVPVCVLIGAAHALPVMAFAVRRETDVGFALVYRFAVIPMFLFAGTFYPVSTLPAALRVVAEATPLWHGTQVCRDLALGRGVGLAAAAHVGYLLAWSVAGLVVALRSYRGQLVA